MSLSITNAFVQQFETEVKIAYQRLGSKLSNLVRKKTNIKGSSTTFFKAGTGTAGTKSRHGMVPLMNTDHTSVPCTLADYYAADYVDKLDELQFEIDERQVITSNAANALGRKADDLVTDAMNGVTAHVIATGATGITKAKVLQVFEEMGNGDIPDDGMRYWLTSPSGWTDLIQIPEFADADYVGGDDLPWKGGMVARRWLGFMFLTYNGLPAPAAGEKSDFAFHSSAVGFASGAEVTSETNYIPERVAHLLTAYMRQGACVIDEQGVWKVNHLN